jgi:hypothetical protein
MKDNNKRIITIIDNANEYIVNYGDGNTDDHINKSDEKTIEIIKNIIERIVETDKTLSIVKILPTTETDDICTVVIETENIIIKTQLYDEKLIAKVNEKIETDKNKEEKPNKNIKNLVIKAAAVVVAGGILFGLVKLCNYNNKKVNINTNSSTSSSQILTPEVDNTKIDSNAKLLAEQIRKEQGLVVDEESIKKIIEIANVKNELIKVEGVDNSNFQEIVTKTMTNAIFTDLSYIMAKIAKLNEPTLPIKLSDDVHTPISSELIFADYIKNNNVEDNKAEYDLVKKISDANNKICATFYQEGKTKDQIIAEIMPEVEMLMTAQEAMIEYKPVFGTDVSSVSELCESVVCMQFNKFDEIVRGLNITDYAKRAKRCQQYINKRIEASMSTVAISLNNEKEDCSSKVLTK